MTDVPMQAMAIPANLGVTASIDRRGLVLHVEPFAALARHGVVRASVLSYLVDAVAGLTVDGDPSTWTFTTDLSVRMRPVGGPGRLSAVARLLRSGGRTATLTVDVVDAADEVVAVGAIGFARVPRRPDDPPKPIVSIEDAPARFAAPGRIDRPLREAAGIVVVDAAAGVVELAVTPPVCNPAGTLQGAMVALVAEAAAEDLLAARSGAPVVVTDLDVRFVAQARVGPVRSRCRVLGDGPLPVVEVELVDTATGRPTTHVLVRAAIP